MLKFHNKVACWDIVGCENTIATVDCYQDQFFFRIRLIYMLQDSKQGNMHVYPSPFFPYNYMIHNSTEY